MQYQLSALGLAPVVRESDKPGKAALSYASELWDSEQWEGDEPLVVTVRNPLGLTVRYRIEVELRQNFKYSGDAEIVTNSRGGAAR